MEISNIWDKTQDPKSVPILKPIEVIDYLDPTTGCLSRSIGIKLSSYNNIVRIRGGDSCIIMCWNHSSQNSHDIFTAKWNDGVVSKLD